VPAPALFLHGGGDSPEHRAATLGRFVAASSTGGALRLALVVVEASEAEAEESFAAYRAIFASLLDPSALHPVFATAERPLTAGQLARLRPSGVFVCGGSTPLYHRALCLDRAWLAYLARAGAPYGGTSAGAAIAAGRAILGGWRAARGGASRAILFQGAGEGLTDLTVADGLGLAPFAVDVHASQMGTLTRLIHAVDLGLAQEGWAIDENTLLQIEGGEAHVFGAGQAYRVWRDAAGAVRVEVRAPEAGE
jgi:cyanophycinase